MGMWDNTEGTIFDPDLFKPKPKPMVQQIKVSQPKPKVVAKKISTSQIHAERIFDPFHQASGLIKTYKKIHSPEYQYHKIQKKLKQEDYRDKLNEARKQLDEKRRAMKEVEAKERHQKIKELKRKLGFKVGLYD